MSGHEKREIIGAGLGCVFAGALTCWLVFWGTKTIAERDLRRSLNRACRQVLLEESDRLALEDCAGNPIRVTYTVERASRTATAESPGYDATWGTGDDMRAEDTDFNKSYIVGRWAGGKAKEAVAGAVRGLVESKSQFAEDEK